MGTGLVFNNGVYGSNSARLAVISPTQLVYIAHHGSGDFYAQPISKSGLVLTNAGPPLLIRNYTGSVTTLADSAASVYPGTSSVVWFSNENEALSNIDVIDASAFPTLSIATTFKAVDQTFSNYQAVNCAMKPVIGNAGMFTVTSENSAGTAKTIGTFSTIAGVQQEDKCAGILQEAGLTGETKNTKLIGQVSAVHSGLTPGAIQYLDNLGGITETPNAFPIGRAISATQMVISKSV